MRRLLALAVLAAGLLFGAGAHAACGPLPYTFVNGTTIDALQVNADLATLLNCANTGNTPVSVNGTTSLDLTFCNSPIIASNGFYTITLPAASGLTNGCVITIFNDDTRGKTLSVNGLTSGGFTYAGCGTGNLCPQQTAIYVATSGGWKMLKNPGPWRPTTATTLFASTTGSTTNDGLNSAQPLTLAFACTARSMIDTSASGTGAVVITIQLADGTYTGATLCSITGNLGASSPMLTNINGNNATPTNVILNANAGGTAFFVKDGGEVTLTNLSIFGNGAGAVGINAGQYAVVDINAGVHLGCEGTTGISIQAENASVNINSTLTVDGPCTQGALISMNNGGRLAGSGSISFPGAVADSYTTGVFVNKGGYWDMEAITFSITATVTGTQFFNYAQSASLGSNQAGYLFTNGTPPSSYFPGNVKVAFPVNFPTDFSVLDTVANCPCGTGSRGQMYAVSDSSTAVWGAAVAGGGGNQVTVQCNGGGLTVIGK